MLKQDGKLRKLSYIKKEINIQPSVDTYEINGIEVGNIMVLYRKDKKSTFQEMSVGDYRIEGDNDNRTLRIINREILKGDSIQIANTFDFTASIYDPNPEFSVDVLTLNQRYNELCVVTSNLWEIVKQQGMIADSIGVDLILPELSDGEFWIRQGDHYEGYKLDDANAKLKEMIDKHSEDYALELERIKELYKQELQRKKNDISSTLNEEKDLLVEELKNVKTGFEAKVEGKVGDAISEIQRETENIVGSVVGKKDELELALERKEVELEGKLTTKGESVYNELNSKIDNIKGDFIPNLVSEKNNVKERFSREIEIIKSSEINNITSVFQKERLEAHRDVASYVKDITISETANIKGKLNAVGDNVIQNITKAGEYGASVLKDALSNYSNNLSDVYVKFENKVTHQIDISKEYLDGYETMKYYEFLEKCNRIIYGLLGELSEKADKFINGEMADMVKKFMNENSAMFRGPRGFEGQKGDKGEKGDTGENGVYLPVDGFVSFGIRDGYLIMRYSGTNPPNFSIDEEGYLVYDFDADPPIKEMDGTMSGPKAVINLENYDGDVKLGGNLVANGSIHARGSVTSEGGVGTILSEKSITNISRLANGKIQVTYSDGSVNEV